MKKITPEEVEVKTLHFVELSFPASHYITGQGGKCENPHGHNYFLRDLTLTFDGELDEKGMLVDFGEVKGYIKDYWDHSMFIPQIEGHYEAWRKLYAHLGFSTTKLRCIKHTTAEWMCKVFVSELANKIPSLTRLQFGFYEGPNQGPLVDWTREEEQ